MQNQIRQSLLKLSQNYILRCQKLPKIRHNPTQTVLPFSDQDFDLYFFFTVDKMNFYKILHKIYHNFP